MSEKKYTCPHCDGEGWITYKKERPSDRDLCYICEGDGSVTDEEYQDYADYINERDVP